MLDIGISLKLFHILVHIWKNSKYEKYENKLKNKQMKNIEMHYGIR